MTEENWEKRLKKEIKRVTVYPAFVLGAILVIFIALAIFVYPRIAHTLEKTNEQIPSVIVLVLFVSNSIRDNMVVALAVIAVLSVLLYLFKRSSKGKLLIDSWKLRIPIIGSMFKEIAVSRFVHQLGASQRAGNSILQSLQAAEEAVKNQIDAQKIAEVKERVAAGKPFSEAISGIELFPDSAVRMAALGDMQGGLQNSIDKLCEYYQEAAPAAVRRTLSVLEPLMILFLAGMILLISLSMYLPIYKMLGTIAS